MRRKFKHGSWYWCKRFKNSEWEPMRYSNGLFFHLLGIDDKDNLYAVGNEIIYGYEKELLSALKEIYNAMIDYEVMQDCEKPYKHRKMMERCYEVISKIEG